jgi:alkanesulfonate monooxygenase SsuD/methylene tetrahydromethanopterin reductase-like flavin-dependent oxidoreductase (luciferase family)
VTERVEIGALVLCMGFRNPALLAKMADTADEISNGRVILGLGAGWHEPEYRAFGFPFDHRFQRFEEGLKIIHGLLRDDRADVDGKYFQANDCVLRPRGPSQSGPPIMIGTTGERMLRLTARYADAWNVFPSRTGNTIEGLLPILRRVDAACEEVGRDPATLERTCAVFVGLPDEPDPGDSPQPLITGSTEELAESLRAFVDVGISHIQLVFHPMRPDSIDAFAPVVELLRRD